MKKLKTNKGITLIALVITIIVLLILAAVSIATLTGENGILSQATKAGESTTQETEKEELKLSFNAAKSKKYEEGDYTGKITAKDLEDELKKQNPNAKVKEASSPIEVTFPSGNVYTVDEETKEIILVSSGSDLENEKTITGDEVTVLNYGDRVNYVSKSDSSLIWRIFYHDEKYVYLISSELEDMINFETNFVTGKRVSEYSVADIDENLKFLNKEWFEKLDQAGDETSESETQKRVAMAMDQEAWKKFKDEQENAIYVIGGPTLELFRNSFNATAKTRKYPDSMVNFTEVNEDGYIYDYSNPAQIAEEDNKGIYYGSYCLASPSGENDYHLFCTFYDEIISCSAADNPTCVRPVALIPKDKFEYKILPQ